MASGCPVIATPNPGSAEITDKGRLGLLVDDRRLGETIVRLLKAPDERERLAHQGLRAVEQYDIHEIAAKYEMVYRGVMLSGRSR
jgi:glycosyltransferase involved in cell wall biosynthesis